MAIAFLEFIINSIKRAFEQNSLYLYIPAIVVYICFWIWRYIPAFHSGSKEEGEAFYSCVEKTLFERVCSYMKRREGIIIGAFLVFFVSFSFLGDIITGKFVQHFMDDIWFYAIMAVVGLFFLGSYLLLRATEPKYFHRNWKKHPPKNAQDFILQAQDNLLKLDHQKALDAYEYALQLEPRNLEAISGKAGTLHELGRFQESLAIADYALAVDPKSDDAYEIKGLALYSLGRHQEAMDCWTAQIGLAPKNAWPYLYRAGCYLKLNNERYALADITAAIKLDPDLAEEARENPEFASLHGNPKFDELVGK